MRQPGRALRSTAGLARLGFTEVATVARLLGQDDDGIGLLRDQLPVSDAAGDLLTRLADAPSPDRAVRALARLLKVHPQPRELLAQLMARPGFAARLTQVLGMSSALGDHLVRHPEDCEVLADDALPLQRPSALGLRTQLLAAVGITGGEPPPWGAGGPRAVDATPATLDRMRATYRRLLLGLAARDLTDPDMPVDDVAAELADLAAAGLAALLAMAVAALPPGAAPCRLAVVAMGKCGGRELNYVSDVDVVFVAGPLKEPVGDRMADQHADDEHADDEHADDEHAALVSANRLAAGIMRLATTASHEPALWPVDAALRPEGRDGALVRSLASHAAYYERWAKTWEFQALLKARPVAGDIALGQRYLDTLAPLVWTAAQRPRFVADVQAMRQRVEANLPAATASREVKLGPGGLRDVEFSVQLLQLVHGRSDPSLRSPATLPALHALAAGGYVGREDAAALAQAYRFFRSVEHRLQLVALRRTHLLPADVDALTLLARSLGYVATPQQSAADQLLAQRSRMARQVRQLHEKLFYRPLLESVARLPTDHARIDDRMTPAAATDWLGALGFADPAGALRHLRALTEGVSRRASIQRTLLPAMMGAFADAADPDAGLLAYRKVSDALGSTPWYLRTLRDSGTAAERLARVLASSAFVADLLVRAPEGVAVLAADQVAPRTGEEMERALLAAVRRRDDWEGGVGAVRALRRAELVRVAVADLEGRLTGEQVGVALSDLAGSTVSGGFEAAWRKVEAERRGEMPFTMAVVALGRLGGHEQGYGSDVDVMFVHRPLAGTDEQDINASALAVAQEMRRLLQLPSADPPLLIDADLRPHGRGGPLVRSLDSYAQYYRRWSQVWEAQALLRARPIAGDPQLGADFVALIDPVRYPDGGPDADAVREVRRLKARMETERLPRGVDPARHPKLGRGGLSDVEWTVQLLQLQHGYELPGLRTTGTLAALQAATTAGLLAAEDHQVLATAWTTATRVRNAMVLARGSVLSSLPGPGPELNGMAMALGYRAASDEAPTPDAGPISAASAGQLLAEDYLRATRRARTVVERVFYGWDESAR